MTICSLLFKEKEKKNMNAINKDYELFEHLSKN